MPTDRLAERLAAIRLRAENVQNCPAEAPDTLWRSVHERSARDVPPLLAALDRVLAVHRPAPGHDGKSRCAWCRTVSGIRELWPCGEYQAITAELVGEPAPAGDKT
jgi:hypothetical protein